MTLRRRGFALLIVIWGIGAIALFVVSFMSTSRLQLQAAYNLSRAAQTGSIATAVTNLSIISLVEDRVALLTNQPGSQKYDGSPRFCTFNGAVAAIAIEDESGKIDINAASEPLLTDVLTRIASISPNDAVRVARAIVDYRTPLPPDATEPHPIERHSVKGDFFQTIMELDQVDGVDDGIFHALLPVVTVYSRSNGLDPTTAPPALFAALVGSPRASVDELMATPFPNSLNRADPRFPGDYKRAGLQTAFLVHVEVSLDDGPSGSRQTIVETRTGTLALYAIREINHGAPRFTQALQRLRAAETLPPPC